MGRCSQHLLAFAPPQIPRLASKVASACEVRNCRRCRSQGAAPQPRFPDLPAAPPKKHFKYCFPIIRKEIRKVKWEKRRIWSKGRFESLGALFSPASFDAPARTSSSPSQRPASQQTASSQPGSSQPAASQPASQAAATSQHPSIQQR